MALGLHMQVIMCSFWYFIFGEGVLKGTNPPTFFTLLNNAAIILNQLVQSY
jgi:hypothetical protein